MSVTAADVALLVPRNISLVDADLVLDFDVLTACRIISKYSRGTNRTAVLHACRPRGGSHCQRSRIVKRA